MTGALGLKLLPGPKFDDGAGLGSGRYGGGLGYVLGGETGFFVCAL